MHTALELCPSEDLFVQFLAGRLQGEAVARLERHAARCVSCMDLLSGAVQLVTPLAELTVDPIDSPEKAAGTTVLRFGPFRVTGHLGRGGMGIVYQALDERTGLKVALKTVRTSRPGALLSLHREIHTLGQIQHPGVVRVVAQGDGDEGDDLAWYAMELVEGQTLATLLARSAVTRRPGASDDRPRLLHILAEVCSTLAVLHPAGIVHRDLSPRNVMVRRTGSPVLVDFGFALVNAVGPLGREVLGADATQVGTLRYMSPEQIRGEASDARSDLYSIGCILYEALTGRPPFLGDAAALIEGHLEVVPPPPSRMAPDVPSGLDQLVCDLLAKRPHERPAYADDVARELLDDGRCPPRPVLRAPALPAAPTTPGYLYRSRLVGRGRTMARLEELLDRCDDGQGAEVILVGESGVGKTRLAMELSSLAAGRGFEVVQGTAAGPALTSGIGSRAEPNALQPLRPLLKLAAARCQAGGRAETARLLGPRGRLLARHEPSLQQVPGLDELPRQPALPGAAGRFRLLDALQWTLAALAIEGPLLLIVDDLQWADELTLALVCGHLRAGFFARHRVLLVGTCREEEMPVEVSRTLGEPAVVRLGLTRLDDTAVREMIADMLPSATLPQAFAPMVASHARGNPFFVVEYLRMALAEQRLRRTEGDWYLVDDPGLAADPLPMPGAVRELVTRRLALLSPPAQLLAELAAVLGGEVEEQLLLATGRVAAPEAAGAPEAWLGALAELVAHQVLEPGEAGSYRFVHAKQREIAYARLDPSRRRSHHGSAALAIEQTRARESDFGRHYAALANHYEAANQPRLALRCLQRAATRALRGGAAREAERLLTRALALDPPRRSRLHRLRAEARFAMADLPACHDDALAVLRDVRGPAPHAPRQWMLLLVGQGMRQLLHRLLPMPWWRARGRDRLLNLDGAVASGLLASVHYFAGEGLPMTATLLLGANLADRAGATAEVISACARLGYIAGLLGLERLAQDFFARSRRLARGCDNIPALAISLYLNALHDLGQGRLADAEHGGSEAVRLLEQVGDLQDGDVARTIVAHAVFFQGRVEEAGQRYRALCESAQRRANSQHAGWALTLQARSLLAAGHAAQAVPLLEQARGLLSPLTDRLSILMCEGLLATAYLGERRLPEAEAVAGTLSSRLADGITPLAPCVHAYVGAASVALAGWRAASAAPAQRQQAAQAVRGLRKFARMFPLARPAALSMQAAAARIAGRQRRAARLERKFMQEAGALGMPARQVLLFISDHSAD